MNRSTSRRQFLTGLVAASGLLIASPALSALASGFRPKGSSRFDHGDLDGVLRRVVKADEAGYNRVDYRLLKTSLADTLKRYVDTATAIDPRSLSRSEAQAYWINLYNAETLVVVAEAYPVRSIRDIDLGGGGLFKSGPWSKKLLSVNGTELSLDDIEHEIVRPLFNDPMSHYGLNCASYSCPNLLGRAYTGQTLKAQLAENAALYVNHPRGVSVDAGEITASKLYHWYAEDFGGKGALKAHWSSLARPDLAEQIRAADLGSFTYDWSLNDV